jgi:hypothetical protein
MKRAEESSAFLKKGAPKTFINFTRGVETTSGRGFKNFFAEIFQKATASFPFNPGDPA